MCSYKYAYAWPWSPQAVQHDANAAKPAMHLAPRGVFLQNKERGRACPPPDPRPPFNHPCYQYTSSSQRRSPPDPPFNRPCYQYTTSSLGRSRSVVERSDADRDGKKQKKRTQRSQRTSRCLKVAVGDLDSNATLAVELAGFLVADTCQMYAPSLDLMLFHVRHAPLHACYTSLLMVVCTGT